MLKNILIACCLIIMLWWFYVQRQNSVVPEAKNKAQEYMAYLTIYNFDSNGKMLQNLQADYWEFLPQQGRSDLLNPVVKIYKANGDLWNLSARRALAWHPTIADKVEQLDMQDDVIINKQDTVVKTSYMEYYPKKELLKSSELVQMQQPGLLISGKGLTGYLNTNHVELHHDITTIYQQH